MAAASTPSLNTGENTPSSPTNKKKLFHEQSYHKPTYRPWGFQVFDPSLLTEDMVNIFVGPKRKNFHIHKALLCHHSSFFQRTLDGGFKEQEDKAVYLPDDDVKAFVLFVHWVYNAPPQKATTPATVAALFALYVMAEKFGIEELKNMSTDAVRSSFCDVGSMIFSEHIERICGHTPEGNAMRRFIANHTAYGLLVRKVPMSKRLVELMKKGGDFTAYFPAATLQYSYGTARPTNPTRERSCAYHEHSFTKGCP